MSPTQRAVRAYLGTGDPEVRILTLNIRWRGRGSVVCIVSTLRAGRLSNRGSTSGKSKSFFSQVCKPTRGPNSVMYSVGTRSAFAQG
jgi:hypothetical protein